MQLTYFTYIYCNFLSFSSGLGLKGLRRVLKDITTTSLLFTRSLFSLHPCLYLATSLFDIICLFYILNSVHSLTHWSSHWSVPFVLPDTNLAVHLACGHTVSLYVCPGNNSNCNALTHGDMVSLDEGRFPALELNNRRLSVKNSFCRKNGVYTRSVILAQLISQKIPDDI